MVLAIIGFFALKQITLLKEQITLLKESNNLNKEDTEVRWKREAATLTAKQCEKFANELITLFDNFLNEMERLGIDIYKGEIKDFKLDNDTIKWMKDYFSKIEQNKDSKLPKLTGDLINYSEAFAIYFIHGICYEEIAFAPLASQYCKQTNYTYPLICYLRRNNDLKFSNLRELYKIWSTKIKALEIQIQSSKLSNEVNKLSKQQEEISFGKQDLFPIGVNKKEEKRKQAL